jgi:hypothetical protein
MNTNNKIIQWVVTFEQARWSHILRPNCTNPTYICISVCIKSGCMDTKWVVHLHSKYPWKFTKPYKNLFHITKCRTSSKRVDDFTCLWTLSGLQLFLKVEGKVQELLTFDPTQVKWIIGKKMHPTKIPWNHKKPLTHDNKCT